MNTVNNEELSPAKAVAGTHHSPIGQTQKPVFKVDACQNCATELKGKYCHQCGQPSRSIIKFFGEVAQEFIANAFGYDSKLRHTVFPLLFKPGKITQDYINGKIFHYVLSIRLYLILSVICFLLMQITTDTKGLFVNDDTAKAPEKLALDKEPSGIIDKRIDSLVPQSADTSVSELDDTDNKQNQTQPEQLISTNQQTQQATLKSPEYFDFDYDDKDETFDFNGQFFSDFPKAKKVIIDIKNKSESWKKDPTPWLNKVFELFPIMMLVILPLFAMTLKLFYLFKRRFYIEHLIFCIHNHCFIYFALILEILFGQLESFLLTQSNSISQFFATVFNYLSTALMIWIIVYILLAIKRFYQQGWWLTIFKSVILSGVYFFMVFFGVLIVAIVGAWQA
ncbi:DUF3667 domain-containing protein [Aliikangiella maris]|uniref:DUF3667 domain-containing protein n=2 Tax=Aliikangiella maris TaxID=3162458 RepID=A0ABV2BWC4_9GAMM